MNKELKGSQINNKLKSISDFINIDYDRIKKRKQELLYQYGKIMSLTICNDTDKDVTIPILNKNSISDLENLNISIILKVLLNTRYLRSVSSIILFDHSILNFRFAIDLNLSLLKNLV